ncbi:MAG TPA: hypothetical protein VL625_00820 [Patescibacteria group bacterium]|nr:hypothetical protein [Patescibacteria group bacterium]
MASPLGIGFCQDCNCEDIEASNTQNYINAEAALTRSRFQPEFDALEHWLVYDLFLDDGNPPPYPQNPIDDDPGEPPSDPLAGATGPSAGAPPGNVNTPMVYDKKWLLPWWMNMAQQMSTAAAWSTLVFGTYFDAKQQLEVQRLMQELQARTHKDYQPTMDVCSWATMTKSLSDTEFRRDANTFMMSRFGQGRSTGLYNQTATEGPKSDREDRLTQFRSRYCDQHDNNNGMAQINCKTRVPPYLAGAPFDPVDRDMDYAGVMERKLTLDLDEVALPTTATDDEEDLYALASNLYGSDAMFRIHEHVFHSEAHKQLELDLRSIMAQRSVAEASFYTIAGMRSPGSLLAAGAPAGAIDSTKTVAYMNIILKDLGIPVAEIPDWLGKQPSYYAQMEFLTKIMFQNPQFYVTLYDTPANVARKKVILQAIGLMQDFDTLQSYLRTEMMLSQILELDLIKLQREVQDRIDRLGARGGRRAS